MTDRVQQGELILGDDKNGEAQHAPLPEQNLEPETEPAAEGVALEPIEDEVDITFTEYEDGRIVGEAPAMQGHRAYTFELQSMDWGLFEDIEAMQQIEDEKRMGEMLKFLHRYVVGGPRKVPLKQTRTIFEAITKYASFAMEPSKN